MKSETVKISRRALEEIRKLAQQVGSADKTERDGLTPGEAYAHALGRCNSLGKEIAALAAVYLG